VDEYNLKHALPKGYTREGDRFVFKPASPASAVVEADGALKWVQGLDLNQRPSGYEPDELPDCSTLQCDGGRDLGRGALSVNRHFRALASGGACPTALFSTALSPDRTKPYPST
jgi:hypothetical protein